MTRIVSYDTTVSFSPTTQAGRGNGEAMQSMENDETVSHPSHSPLEDADEASVSHIPTATTTTYSLSLNQEQTTAHLSKGDSAA